MPPFLCRRAVSRACQTTSLRLVGDATSCESTRGDAATRSARGGRNLALRSRGYAISHSARGERTSCSRTRGDARGEGNFHAPNLLPPLYPSFSWLCRRGVGGGVPKARQVMLR